MNSSQPLFFAGGPSRWRAAGGVEVTVVLPVILAGACLAGLVENLLLLVILSCELRRGKRSPASALVLNLCSADLILVLFCIPTRIATYSRRSWVFGGFVCKTTNWLLHGCLVAKCLTWAAVGQARYKHVVSSSCNKCLGWSWKRVAGVLSSVWATALLLPLPHLLFTHVDFSPRTGFFYCVFQAPPHASNFMDVFSKVYPLLAYLAPSGFAWSCYWRALRVQEERRQRKRLAKPGHQSSSSSSSSRKVTWLLLSLSALFQATWLPEWVVWLWERHSPPGEGGPQPPAALLFLAEVLVSLNSCLSPGLFMAISEEFREGLRSVCRELNCKAAQGRPAGARAAAGEAPQQALRVLEGEAPAEAAAEKVLPDVEHFWEDRSRNAAAGEESDPVPWEHQACC